MYGRFVKYRSFQCDIFCDECALTDSMEFIPPHFLEELEQMRSDKTSFTSQKGRLQELWAGCKGKVFWTCETEITMGSAVVEVLVPNLLPCFVFVIAAAWVLSLLLFLAPGALTLLEPSATPCFISWSWQLRVGSRWLERSWDPICWIPETSVGKIRWLYFHPSFLPRTSQSNLSVIVCGKCK